jgi:hypothetical protein
MYVCMYIYIYYVGGGYVYMKPKCINYLIYSFCTLSYTHYIHTHIYTYIHTYIHTYKAICSGKMRRNRGVPVSRIMKQNLKLKWQKTAKVIQFHFLSHFISIQFQFHYIQFYLIPFTFYFILFYSISCYSIQFNDKHPNET